MGLARLPGSFTASLTLERGVIKVCKRACAFDPRAAGPTNAPMCCPQPGVAVVTPTGARNYLSHGERLNLPSQLATKTAVTPASTYGHSCGQQRYETGATWRQHGRTWPTLPSHHAVTAAATAVTAASAHTTTDTAINTCRHSTPRTWLHTPKPNCRPSTHTWRLCKPRPQKKFYCTRFQLRSHRTSNYGHTTPAPRSHQQPLAAAPGRVCGARARCQTRKARLPEKSVACMQGTFMLAAALLGLSLSATTLAAARPPWTCARLWPASRAGSISKCNFRGF